MLSCCARCRAEFRISDISAVELMEIVGRGGQVSRGEPPCAVEPEAAQVVLESGLRPPVGTEARFACSPRVLPVACTKHLLVLL